MSPEQAALALRAALTAHGVRARDSEPSTLREHYAILSAEDAEIWCGPERYRWPSPGSGRMIRSLLPLRHRHHQALILQNLHRAPHRSAGCGCPSQACCRRTTGGAA
ncbi:hypothetical protein [Thermocatellispora tengchongensis]|uniref:hypothetical protein n=1 Tax=Thermocatellispora tengchongensis TaxID=1073253 RepID=UPI00362F6D76